MFAIISFALLQSNYFNFLRSFQTIKFLTNTFFKSIRENWKLFVNVKKTSKNYFLEVLCHYFNCIATIKVLQFLTFISDHCVFNKFTQMPSLNRYEKVTCENCGTQTTKLNLARHRKRCSAGTLHCSNVPISPQNYRLTWIIILLRSTAPQNLISPSSVNYVMQNFPAFIPYVNTDTLNMYHKWDSERSEQYWCGGYSGR